MKKQIKIYGTWPLKVPQNLSELLGNYSVKYRKEKHQGTGDWHFPPIRVKNDFQNIKNFFQEYKDYCGDKPKLD